MVFSCLRLAVLGAAVAHAVRVDEEEEPHAKAVPLGEEDPVVKEIFKANDKNKDGGLDREELAKFATGGKEHGSMSEDGELPPLVRTLLGSEGTFTRFDKNRDNKLEPCEINNLIRSANSAMKVDPVKNSTYRAHGNPSPCSLQQKGHGKQGNVILSKSPKTLAYANDMEKEIFEKCDKKGKGYLVPADLSIFSASQAEGGPFPENGKLPPLVRHMLGSDDLFLHFDTDRDGKICRGELGKALEAAMVAVNASAADASPTPVVVGCR